MANKETREKEYCKKFIESLKSALDDSSVHELGGSEYPLGRDKVSNAEMRFLGRLLEDHIGSEKCDEFAEYLDEWDE